jgi:hypothetical protein
VLTLASVVLAGLAGVADPTPSGGCDDVARETREVCETRRKAVAVDSDGGGTRLRQRGAQQRRCALFAWQLDPVPNAGVSGMVQHAPPLHSDPDPGHDHD